MRKILFIVTLFVVCLWSMVMFAPRLLLPGVLSAGHSDLGWDCFACHTPFQGPDSEKCLRCHPLESIDSNGSQKAAFHNRLSEAECTACHFGHQGRYRQSTTQRTFSHDMLQRSDRSQCSGCHTAPQDALHAQVKGTCDQCHSLYTWQGAVFDHAGLTAASGTACRECHTPPDDRVHTAAASDCSQCHGVKDWSAAAFDHGQYFRLDADHDTECQTCHPDENFDSYTCYGCHEHSADRIADEHREEGIRDYQDCAECHRSGSKHGREHDDEHGYRRESEERRGHDRNRERRRRSHGHDEHRGEHDHDE